MEENKIVMLYPIDYTGENPLYDGDFHEIRPISITPISINGREFFVLDYFDYNANAEMTTLLIIINNNFYKVPLTDYDKLREFLASHNFPKLPASAVNLGNRIGLAMTISIGNIIDSSKDGIDIEKYVPLNPNGNTNVSGSILSSSSVIINPVNNNEEYQFEKNPDFNLQNMNIQNGVQNYYIDENGIKKYDFTIDIPEGTVGTIIEYGNDKRARLKQVMLIPGKFNYHVTYADFIDQKDYVASKMANTMSITGATWSEYRDSHDRERAFRDAGIKKLTASFYNGNGKVNDKHI